MTESLFDVPSSSVDERTAALLDLIAGDPIHAEDRRRIVAAIVAEAKASHGFVDPNKVRIRLTNRAGVLTVYPSVIGAVYFALTRSGQLATAGWLVNQDHSGNSGKPLRRYRLKELPA